MSIYTLNEINQMIYNLQTLIQDGADIEEIEALMQAIETVEIERNEKLESYVMVIKNLRSDIEGIKAEEKRLAERRRSMENSILRMEQSIKDTLRTVEGNKVKTTKYNIGLRKSTSVQVVDEKLIPQQFIKTETNINKQELSKYLKAGHKIQGASLVENQSLNIR